VSSLATAAFMVAAFVGVLAGPASAVSPPTSVQSFNPSHTDGGGLTCVDSKGNDGHRNDYSGTNCTDDTTLSDKADGNGTVHVTGVASSNADRMIWSYCTTGHVPPSGSCTTMGEDDSGVTPTAVDGGSNPVTTDEAYDIEFDIPSSLDGVTRDVVAEACNGAPDGTHSNCVDDTVTDVLFDDSGSGANPQTTAGDITTPAHGSSVSNNGFTATASTSAELDRVVISTEETTDSTNIGDDVDYCSSDDDTTPDTTSATVDTWSASLATCGDNTDSVSLFSENNTFASGVNASCDNGDDGCLMDRHWIAGGEPVPTTAVITLPDQATSAHPDGSCDEPITTGTDVPDSTETVEGCLYDQGGNNVTNDFDWAYQVTPVDTKASQDPDSGYCCGDGEENDTNSDQFREQVDGDPGDAGSEADEGFYAIQAQQYTLTFCYDSNNDAEDTPPGILTQSATPCAGESVSATATKTITAGTGGTNDVIRFAADAGADPTCPTGNNSTSAPADQPVNVVECVFDDFGNPVAGAKVQWFVDYGPGNYTAQQQTTDANGRATATFGNGAEGVQTGIYSCEDDLDTDTFTDDCSNDLLINWQAPTPPPVQHSATTLTLAKDVLRHRVKFFGSLTAAKPNVCNTAGKLIKLFRGRRLIDVTHTNAAGDYRFKRPKAHRRRLWHTLFPGTTNCNGDRSNNVRSRAR